MTICVRLISLLSESFIVKPKSKVPKYKVKAEAKGLALTLFWFGPDQTSWTGVIRSQDHPLILHIFNAVLNET